MKDLLRKYWVVPAIFGVFLAVFIVLLPFMGTGDNTWDHSTQRLNRYGCTALAELVARVDPALKVERITQPLDNLAEVDGLLMIIDPERPFKRQEIEELLRWVEMGGTVIIGLQSVLDDFSGAQRGAALAQMAITQAFGVQLVPTFGDQDTAYPTEDSPLAAGVDAVRITSHATILVDSGDSSDSDDGLDIPFDIGLPPVLAPQKQSDLTVHLTAERGNIMVSFEHGEGTVFLSSDVDLFSNAHITDEDNVLFVANLLWGYADTGTIYFDEYHHGFTLGADAASGVDPGPLKRAWWVTAVGFAIFLFAGGKRFGAPIKVFDARRRTVMEYIEALAGLFNKANADLWALRKIELAFRQRLAMATGLPVTADFESLSAGASPVRGAPDTECAELLAELRGVIAGTALSRKQLLAFVRRISAIEERLPTRAHGPTRRANL